MHAKKIPMLVVPGPLKKAFTDAFALLQLNIRIYFISITIQTNIYFFRCQDIF